MDEVDAGGQKRQSQQEMFDPAAVVRRATGARLIGIDGLPVSGKSTLAEALAESLGASVIYLDDFVRPELEWRGRVAPGFPFPYMRHEAFFSAVETLIEAGSCCYPLYDWETGEVGKEMRHITLDRPVIFEGVSALCARLYMHYDLRIWVESDAATTLSASLARGVGAWAQEWQELFLPSVDLYLAERPWERADFVVRGRGA